MASSSMVLVFVFIFHNYGRVESYDQEANKGCGDPGVPVSGGINSPMDPDYKVGSYVTYFCQPSHQLFGDTKRTCTQNGFWSGNVPTCGSRLVIQNVNQSSNFNPSSLAYKAIDMDYTTCSMTKFSQNNFWYGTIDSKVTVSGVRITVPKKANEPAFNLTVKIASQSNNNFVRCLKTEGYVEPIDKKHRHFYLCPQNSQGTTIFLERITDKPIPLDLCEVEIFTTQNVACKIPDNPKNTHKMINHSANGTYYVYSCRLGFELKGAGMIHCSSNGTWHPKVPTCVAITCSLVPAISNGYYRVVAKSNDKRYNYNDSVEYHCDAGYELIGDSSRQKFCVGVNRWSGNPLYCKEKRNSQLTSTTHASTTKSPGKCSQFKSISNGNLIYVKDMAILQCNQGFEPLTDWNSTCVLSATGRYSWSPIPVFSCGNSSERKETLEREGEIFCPPPSFPKGMRLLEDIKIGGKFEVGTEIRIRCLFNDGDAENVTPTGAITCSTNGTWDNVNLKCIELGLSSDKVMLRPSKDSTNFYIVAAFLIGVGTAVVIIGVLACLFVLRKSRLTGTQQSQSLFHIDFTDTLNSRPRNTLMRMNSYRTNNRPVNEDEHIYQIPAYGEIDEIRCGTSSTSEPETPKKREPSSGLPLIPLYSQPFEGTLISAANSQLNIYAEPILGIYQNSNVALGSSWGSFSDASLYFSNGETRTQANSPDSMTYNDLYSENNSLRMVDNDLYVSEDESTK